MIRKTSKPPFSRSRDAHEDDPEPVVTDADVLELGDPQQEPQDVPTYAAAAPEVAPLPAAGLAPLAAPVITPIPPKDWNNSARTSALGQTKTGIAFAILWNAAADQLQAAYDHRNWDLVAGVISTLRSDALNGTHGVQKTIS